MAELYVKPGNQQRGWNDPPQFSYGLQQRPAPSSGWTQRGPFRRVTTATEGKEPEAVPQPAVASSPVGLLTPQSVNLPPSGPPASSFQRADATRPSVVETDKEYDAEDVLFSLHEALNNCRSFVQKQVWDDIRKRLVILQEMWAQGKLSYPVRKRMGILTEELKSQHWDAADEIHRSLMVDHVAEAWNSFSCWPIPITGRPLWSCLELEVHSGFHCVTFTEMSRQGECQSWEGGLLPQLGYS